MATWTGQGVGKSTGGKIRFCGSIFFKASLNGGKLSFLNNLVGFLNSKLMNMEIAHLKYGNGNKNS